MTIGKFKKQDLAFLLSLLAGAVLFVLCLQGYPGYVDESFYPTAALRLINGDSLVADEWHLSQFSSIFLYLPVRLLLAVKGSADGMVFFLRCLYLAIHTGCAVGVYAFFRKYGIVAVLVSMLFYTQTPMQLLSLSYNSLFALFLLALCFLLLTLSQKQKTVFYILAGIVYACACVCNPVFCCVFPVYLAAAAAVAFYCSSYHRKKLLLTNKQRQKKNKKLRPLPQKNEYTAAFFSRKAVLFFTLGIAAVAVVCLVFFFATGGTLSAFSENFKHLLSDTEHGIFRFPLEGLLDKVREVATAFNTISFKLFFLPFLLFAALLFDKKRREPVHRTVYVLLSFALAVFYTVGVSVAVMQGEGNVHFFSLPFLLFSCVCYILTENKNKRLFYLLWLPGVVGALAQHMASNLALLAIGWVLAISNLAGAFFVCDLFREISADKEEGKKAVRTAASIVLCLSFVLQISLQSISMYLRYDVTQDYRLIENGPYENLHIKDRYYGTYQLSLADLDEIKDRSSEDTPVLILSDMTWLYLYIDRPFGSYSAWQLSFEPKRLEAYYELNPEKIPKYIYISAVMPRMGYGVSFKMAEEKAAVMKEMFDCKQEKMARGILLTVKE